uniref:Uncharacterized protein n=1 Tax=Cucumis melo TaxID=3656 RepID=A0A9I9EBY8_CUCME
MTNNSRQVDNSYNRHCGDAWNFRAEMIIRRNIAFMLPRTVQSGAARSKDELGDQQRPQPDGRTELTAQGHVVRMITILNYSR